MKLTAFPKTVFCLALLLCWGSFAPPVAAQQGWGKWEVVVISALPQTVEVQTPRGIYSAVFQNEVRVYPNGSASGFLDLSQPDGTLRSFQIVSAGRVQFRDGTVSKVLLWARAADTRVASQGDPDMPIIIASLPNAEEDCLIYTTVGPDVHVATWEAQGRIVVVRD